MEGAACLKVTVAIRRGVGRARDWTGIKMHPSRVQATTTTLFIDMGDPTSSSDIPPSEWDDVSVLAVYPPNPCPQDLVFFYATRKSGLLRLRGDPFLPERPRITNLYFTRLRH